MSHKLAIIRKIENIRKILQEIQDSVIEMEGLKESSRTIPVKTSSQLLDLKLEIENLILKIRRKELKKFEKNFGK